MAELRSSTSIGGNLAWHTGNLRFDTQGNTIRFAGYKLYSENDKPTPAEVGAVNKTGDTMTGPLVMDRTSIVVTNPTNSAAINSFGYINNIPTIRYGGNGVGAGAGFNIASASDIVKFRVAEDGELYANGTKQVLHVLNYNTTLDSVYAKRAQSDTITGAWTFNSVPKFNAASANGPASILIGDKEVHKGSDSGIYLRSGSNTLGINGSNIPVFNGSRLTRVDQTETVAASWSFTAIPSSSVVPTTGSHVVNKTYADQQDALRLALTGGTLTGALAGTYFKTNEPGSSGGDANYGFYVYGTPDSSISYGMTLIDPAATNTQWGTNIFAAGQANRFVYFTKKNGASAAYTSFAVAAKIDVTTGEIYAAGGTKQVLHTGNYTTTLDSRYVNKTGDSMSGTLNTPEVVITGTTGVSITKGNIDGATSASANVQFKSWYGIGFAPTIPDQTVPLNENAVWINVRSGQLNARGTITAPVFSGALSGNATTATKLSTARTLTYTGHATGSGTYDGSANTSIALTLADSGVAAGTYKSVTTDVYGRVTNGTNPTTLAGYGITDALNLAGGTLTGTLAFSNSGTTKRGISGANGDNDSWFVGGGATAVNAGFLELATGDDGTEPVLVRQYTGAAGSGTVVRTLTLLDGYGNTTVPGTLASGGQITASWSGAFGFSSQNTNGAPFFNQYTSSGASEFHPLVKMRGTPSSGVHWTSTLGQLLSGSAIENTCIHAVSSSGSAQTWYFKHADGVFETAGVAVRQNGYIDVTNSSGGLFRVGGNGFQTGSKSTVYGSIAVSNGNLHIDSGSDKWAYINYYSGAGIYFGNGAGGSSANVTAEGRFSGISYAWSTAAIDAVSGGNPMSRFVDPTNHVGVFAGPNKSSCIGSNYYFDGSAWQVRSASYVANRLEITANGWEFYRRTAGGSDGRVALIDTSGNLSLNGSVTAGGLVKASRFATSAYDSGVVDSFSCGGWFRSSGATGWFSQSYGGGIYMGDSTWVRTYGTKKFFVDNTDADAIYTLGGVKANGNVQAATFNGLALDTFTSDDTIVVRDATGDIRCRFLRPEYADTPNISGAIAFRVTSATDNNFLQFCNSPAAVRTWLGAPSLALATTSVNGLMSYIDKANINNTARTKNPSEYVLWSGEAGANTASIAVTNSLYGYSAIRFEGINADKTIAWTHTLAAHEWNAMCASGYHILIGSAAGYYWVFKNQAVGGLTLTRHTNNVYLTKIVGLF